MKKFLTLILIFNFQFSLVSLINAQPQARRNQQPAAAAQQKANNTLTTRAQISFPTAPKLEEDVVWRRDIYRQIDLKEGPNSGLYYPVEPVGSQMNLFTYLFKLVLSGQVKAYEYRLDGNESFEADAVVKPLTLLDNYHIYYEKKDGRLKLDNSDIPSREVMSYYIKESAYYDQKSATFHNTVIALCPIMSREDDFSSTPSTYPLFWVKYSDIAPFLTKQTIMTSDINNASVMSIDDYFVKNMYRGKIYKTNNMLGQTLAQYCRLDTIADTDDREDMEKKALAKEQNRIERELIAFEENIWGDKARKDSLDSIAKIQAAQPKQKKSLFKKRSATVEQATPAAAAAPAKQQKVKEPKQKAASTSSSARVSVRRQRH